MRMMKRRKSISPISRLVEILPQDAFEAENDKESLDKIAKSPEDLKVNQEKPPPPKRPESRRRLSVTSRIDAMMQLEQKEQTDQKPTDQ